jgi:hypothetical protein
MQHHLLAVFHCLSYIIPHFSEHSTAPCMQSIELETKLKPFIPDYIPSIGGIDEFIKVPRPDSKPDFLGLKVGRTTCCRTNAPGIVPC